MGCSSDSPTVDPPERVEPGVCILFFGIGVGGGSGVGNGIGNGIGIGLTLR